MARIPLRRFILADSLPTTRSGPGESLPALAGPGSTGCSA
jgi:hypothetical protein